MQTLNGMLSLGYEWDELYIGDKILSDVGEEYDGEFMKLRYYLSNEPINPDTVVEDMLRTFYEGQSEADSTYMHGTTWTGCYGHKDKLMVGGHDIIAELSEHLGEYCYLIIETN